MTKGSQDAATYGMRANAPGLGPAQRHALGPIFVLKANHHSEYDPRQHTLGLITNVTNPESSAHE